MGQVTKSMVRSAFREFCKKKRIPTSAIWYKKKRRYSKKWLKLDYNSYYGGWRMDWVFPNTSEDFYRGMTRRNTREMYAYLQGLLRR